MAVQEQAYFVIDRDNDRRLVSLSQTLWASRVVQACFGGWRRKEVLVQLNCIHPLWREEEKEGWL